MGKINEVALIKASQRYDGEPDLDQLKRDLENTIHEYNQGDFTVVSVTPITKGKYDSGTYGSEDDSAYGYGFSYTSGLIVTFEKEMDN